MRCIQNDRISKPSLIKLYIVLSGEGEGTLRLGAADGGGFALGGERVGVDGDVVGGGGLGEMLERV